MGQSQKDRKGDRERDKETVSRERESYLVGSRTFSVPSNTHTHTHTHTHLPAIHSQRECLTPERFAPVGPGPSLQAGMGAEEQQTMYAGIQHR